MFSSGNKRYCMRQKEASHGWNTQQTGPVSSLWLLQVTQNYGPPHFYGRVNWSFYSLSRHGADGDWPETVWGVFVLTDRLSVTKFVILLLCIWVGLWHYNTHLFLLSAQAIVYCVLQGLTFTLMCRHVPVNLGSSLYPCGRESITLRTSDILDEIMDLQTQIKAAFQSLSAQISTELSWRCRYISADIRVYLKGIILLCF